MLILIINVFIVEKKISKRSVLFFLNVYFLDIIYLHHSSVRSYSMKLTTQVGRNSTNVEPFFFFMPLTKKPVHLTKLNQII